MSKLNNLGFMQGRLSPSEKNKIQFFPEKNWEEEFYNANKIGPPLVITNEALLEGISILEKSIKIIFKQ